MSDVTLPDLPGFVTYHGIRVCVLGEDGDQYVALGHHEPKQTLQAFNSYSRSVMGLEDIYDGLRTHDAEGWREALNEVTARWAVLREHCDGYDGPDGDHDPDCYLCREIADAGWWLDWGVAEDAPGAFPIMTVTV